MYSILNSFHIEISHWGAPRAPEGGNCNSHIMIEPTLAVKGLNDVLMPQHTKMFLKVHDLRVAKHLPRHLPRGYIISSNGVEVDAYP